MKLRLITPLMAFSVLTILSCRHTRAQPGSEQTPIPKNSDARPVITKVKDSIILSQKHQPHTIICNLDGDHLTDTVNMVQNVINKKYGLQIIFGNKTVAYLGMGKEVLGQGFDDMDWVELFEKAPKNGVYYNNVNDEGNIITEDEVKEADKIRLPNDGIFTHMAEACGGGIIYMKDGKFEWIQQE